MINRWNVISIIVLLFSVLVGHAQVPFNMESALLPVPAKLEFGTDLWELPDTLSIKGPKYFFKVLPGRSELKLYSSILKVPVSEGSGRGISFQIDTTLVRKYNKESYHLVINPSGITIEAASKPALVYALQTIHQLLIYKEGKIHLPHCEITDYPDSPWRGLLLDVTRHFIPVKILYRTVDAMSACKMNVLHFHFCDDQAFRVECKAFPLLHQKGNDGKYYTQEELKALIKYAADRGIQIVPEFDIPGHTTAWLTAYPEYASLTVPQKPESGFGVFKPVFNPANEKLYKHLDIFFKEMSALFPGEYIHIGGDEVRSDDWLNNPDIKKFMHKRGDTTLAQLQNYFNSRVEDILKKYHKKIIGWDEILEGKPSQGTIIQSWRGGKNQEKALHEGYGVIRSHGFYLDQTYTAGEYYSRFDTSYPSHYLGAEAAMWAELVDSITVESRLWPNAAAIADIYWRHPKQMDSIAFYKRLFVFMAMNGSGITNESYVEEILKRRGERFVEYPSPVYSYLTPIDGYRRHKMIKADKAYNTSYQLTTYADLGKPSSSTYITFLITLSNYKTNPSEENRAVLEAYFKQWIYLGEMEKTMPVSEVAQKEWSLILLSLKQSGEAGMLWLNGDKAKAKEMLAEARRMLAGKEYELNIFRLLEATF